jgi:hypothetical protein
MTDSLPPTWRDREGSCIVCLTETDTALGFAGEPEWLVASLVQVGVPDDQAVVIVNRRDLAARHPESFPEHGMGMVVQVCANCVERSGQPLPRPTVLFPAMDVPFVTQDIDE